MTKIPTAILIVILLFLTIPTVSCGQPYKVTIVFSYSKDLPWDTNVLKGIKSALKDMSVDYIYLYMDTKQPRTPTYMKEIASKAIKLIQKVKPDLVITIDDNALRLVAKNFYKKGLHLVFGGVNAPPQKNYGIKEGHNITGVLETVYVEQSLKLFHFLCPKIKSIVLVSPDSYTNRYVYRTLVKGKHFPVKIKKTIFLSSFSQYKKVVSSLSANEGLFLFGYFALKGKTSPVLDKGIIRWTVKHNKRPELALFESQIRAGALCGVVTDGKKHGYRVGLLAKKVLNGTPPSKIPFEQDQIGTIAINIDRAHMLNIQLPFGILLSAKIYRFNPLSE